MSSQLRPTRAPLRRSVDDREAAWGAPTDSEPRWPASLAVLAALALYITLDVRFQLPFGPPTLRPIERWVTPALEMALLLPLSVHAPRRHRDEPKWARIDAVALIALLNLSGAAHWSQPARAHRGGAAGYARARQDHEPRGDAALGLAREHACGQRTGPGPPAGHRPLHELHHWRPAAATPPGAAYACAGGGDEGHGLGLRDGQSRRARPPADQWDALSAGDDRPAACGPRRHCVPGRYPATPGAAGTDAPGAGVCRRGDGDGGAVCGLYAEAGVGPGVEE
jgi:hypothetical protein